MPAADLGAGAVLRLASPGLGTGRSSGPVLRPGLPAKAVTQSGESLLPAFLFCPDLWMGRACPHRGHPPIQGWSPPQAPSETHQK